jgi:hypothetical protein
VKGEGKRGRKRRLTAASLGQFLYGVFVGVDVAGMEPMLLFVVPMRFNLVTNTRPRLFSKV